MKTSYLTAAAVAIALAAGCAQQTQDTLTLLIGTYTDESSEGIYSYGFDQATGQWTPLRAYTEEAAAKVSNPSFLTRFADRDEILCICENGSDEDCICRYGLDRDSGVLTLEASAKTATTGPCYVSTDGTIALTANYLGGSLDIFSLDGGTVLTGSIPATLGGPHPNQSEPHCHCAFFAPDGLHVLATDFSADRVRVFRKAENGTLSPVSDARVKDGTGPRHIAFGPDGRFAYVIGELSGEVSVFKFSDGELETVQTVAADSLGGHGSADIHLSPDGSFLYASNRLVGDGIAVFRVDPDAGTLTHVGYCDTARHPRNFCISPNGLFVLCACRDDDTVQIFRRDPATGLLSGPCTSIPVSRPVCVTLL